MLDLSNVTIVTANCVRPIKGIESLRYSSLGIKFKEAILFTDKDIRLDGIKTVLIPTLTSVDAYNDFILRLADHVDSDYVLVVQDDGFVLNPDLWDWDFFKVDYIGAPWPAEESWCQRQMAKDYMKPGWNRVGNGGFSLRSRKFIELSARFDTCHGYGEDAFLCTVKYDYMIENGIKFAPVDLATKFSYENNLEDWQNPGRIDPKAHFGFHGKNFVNSQELIDIKENYRW